VPERWITTDLLWKWIDSTGAIWGREAYLDRDPPHIAPMDGKEYVDKRGVNGKRAGSVRKLISLDLSGYSCWCRPRVGGDSYAVPSPRGTAGEM